MNRLWTNIINFWMYNQNIVNKDHHLAGQNTMHPVGTINMYLLIIGMLTTTTGNYVDLSTHPPIQSIIAHAILLVIAMTRPTRGTHQPMSVRRPWFPIDVMFINWERAYSTHTPITIPLAGRWQWIGWSEWSPYRCNWIWWIGLNSVPWGRNGWSPSVCVGLMDLGWGQNPA